MGVRGQRHALAALNPRGEPGTHCTGGWVGDKVTGIRPFYPHVFSNTDFLLSEVRNRLQGIWNYDPTSENDKAFQMFVSFEKKATDFNTCANASRINRYPRAVKRRRMEHEFLHRISFPSRKQKQPSR
jgi:hypothetical protein